jgi:hypothetical protein
MRITSNNKTIEDPEQYAVYKSVLDEGGLSTGLDRVFIRASGFTLPAFWLKLAEGLIDTTPEIMANLEANAAHGHLLENRFALNVPVTLLQDPEWEEIFPANGPSAWERFHSKYPDAKRVFFLSPVGFDVTKQTAVVFVDYSFGFQVGEGYVYSLTKSDNAWQIQKKKKYTV